MILMKCADISSVIPEIAVHSQTIGDWTLQDQDEVRRQAQKEYTKLLHSRRQSF